VLFGRQVHSSGIGGLKSRLRTSLKTPVTVERTETTTGGCFACGKRYRLRKGLGLSPDQAVGLDRSELKPPEREAAVRILGSNPYIRVSFPR